MRPERHLAGKALLFSALLLGLLPMAARAQAPERAPGTSAASPATTLGSDAPVSNAQDEKVVEIRVEGNRRVEAEAVRRAIRHNTVGKPFDATKTADDLRALWSQGWFTDVQLLVQRLPKGGVVYVVWVTERPTVRDVKLEGNEELSKDDFKEVIDIKAFSILDMDAVHRNVKKIQDKYVEKGYFLAEVTSRIDKLSGGNAVNVVFVIREHAKVMVKEINLLGAVKVPAEELKAQMLTKQGGYLSFLTGEGTYREEMFQHDLQIIQAAYWDRGYINVKVEKPTISLSSDKKYIYITLRVDEGEPYKIGKINFSGDVIVPQEILRSVVSTQEGEYFNRSKLGKDMAALTDIYYDHGYAYANITPVTTPSAGNERTIDFSFEIQKGNQVTIEKIEITGNTKTRDKVIRREMRVYEGELFNGTGLKHSKDRVTALGFFETVEVTHKPGTDDKHVVVMVEVKEKATGTFQVGFGFSSVEQLIFTAQISQNNFLGWGQTVSLSAQYSSLRQLYQFSYFDPYFLDTNFVFSLDAYKTESLLSDFLRDSTGGDVNFGYHLTEDLVGNVAYTREYVAVTWTGSNSINGQSPLANLFCESAPGYCVRSALRASLTYDRRDNRLFPTKGYMAFASAEVGPSWLGGDLNYVRYSGFARYYQPLPWGMVFKVNGTIGYMASLSDKPVPISERYLIGGINSLRGYALASVSPTSACVLSSDGYQPSAPLGCKVGGTKELIFNFELEFPIIEKVGIRGVIFYDAGNAYSEKERFFQDTYHNVPLGLLHSVGFGFRWLSPIGPLRFEWGIPLTRRAEDVEPILFEFTIGNFF